MKTPRLVIALALVAGVVSTLISWKVLELNPHIPDEVAYVFQSRIFATGHLWLQPPAFPEAFRLDHILITQNRWCSIYPPGWPMLLAIGSLFHAPWLINPLLLTLSIVGVWHLGRLLFDSRTASIAVFLYACSPFVLLQSAGFMAHPSALCASVWCMVAMFSDRPRAAGILGGLCFLIRPFTAITFLWPVFIWRRKSWRGYLPGWIGAILFLAAYNWLLFGNPMHGGYPSDPGWKSSYSYMEAFLTNAPWYFQNLNKCLWGWPVPDLLIFVPLLFNWRRETRPLTPCILCIASLVIAHCFYFWRDIVYSGPRFAYEAMGLFALLAARPLETVFRVREGDEKRNTIASRLLIAVVSVLCLTSLLTRLPEQLQYHSQIYHGQRPFEIPAQVGDDALIFVSGHPDVLASFFLRSSGHRLFVRDIPELRKNLFAAFPRREVWIVKVNLKPLPGPNTYVDRWTLAEMEWITVRSPEL